MTELDDRPQATTEQIRGLGRVFTTHFRNFTGLLRLFTGQDVAYFAVTRTAGWKRGGDKYAKRRRQHIRWFRELSPSNKLRKRADSISWHDFIKSYREEMQSDLARAHVGELTELLIEGTNVILLCYELRGEHCHRHTLADIVADAAFDALRDEYRLTNVRSRVTFEGGELLR